MSIKNIVSSQLPTITSYTDTGSVTGIITSSVTANTITSNGNIIASGMTITGNAVITGDALIQGNLTYNDVTNLTTANLVLSLGNTQSGVAVNDGGITVGSTDEAQFLYNQPDQTWDSNLGITAMGNITAPYFIGDGTLLTGLYTNTNVTNLLASGNVTSNVVTTANVIASNLNALSLNSRVDAILGNTANASATKLRLTTFAQNSYIQTGNGTVGTTGNIVFAPWSSDLSAVSINTGSGDITATGNINAKVDGYDIGYRIVPQIVLTGSRSMYLDSSGKHYYSTLATNTSLAITSMITNPWPIGTSITIINRGNGTILITRESGVLLYLAGNPSGGNKSIVPYGMATIIMVEPNIWMINGTGVTL